MDGLPFLGGLPTAWAQAWLSIHRCPCHVIPRRLHMKFLCCRLGCGLVPPFIPDLNVSVTWVMVACFQNKTYGQIVLPR